MDSSPSVEPMSDSSAKLCGEERKDALKKCLYHRDNIAIALKMKYFICMYVSTYSRYLLLFTSGTSVNKANKSRKVFSGDGFYFCIFFNALLKRDIRNKTQGTEVRSINQQ